MEGDDQRGGGVANNNYELHQLSFPINGFVQFEDNHVLSFLAPSSAQSQQSQSLNGSAGTGTGTGTASASASVATGVTIGFGGGHNDLVSSTTRSVANWNNNDQVYTYGGILF